MLGCFRVLQTKFNTWHVSSLDLLHQWVNSVVLNEHFIQWDSGIPCEVSSNILHCGLLNFLQYSNFSFREKFCKVYFTYFGQNSVNVVM